MTFSGRQDDTSVNTTFAILSLCLGQKKPGGGAGQTWSALKQATFDLLKYRSNGILCLKTPYSILTHSMSRASSTLCPVIVFNSSQSPIESWRKVLSIHQYIKLSQGDQTGKKAGKIPRMWNPSSLTFCNKYRALCLSSKSREKTENYLRYMKLKAGCPSRRLACNSSLVAREPVESVVLTDELWVLYIQLIFWETIPSNGMSDLNFIDLGV
jgi:hypothetical protein